MNRATLVNILKAYREMISDEEALEHQELYPLWKTNTYYNIDARRRYNNVLYKCLQAHTSQYDWTPDVAVSLWAKVLIDGDEITEWEQPESTNPYMAGDKVSHNGLNWVSDIDNNVWEPGVYGWTQLLES